MKTFITLAGVLLCARAFATPEGVPLQYIDARGRQPQSTRIDVESHRGAYTRAVLEAPVAMGTDAQKVVLLVDAGVAAGIGEALSLFQADLAAEGYTVLVWMIDGGSASDIRADLQAEYALGSLSGAIAIGDIPTGWVENGFGQYPIDAYLMDMNGTWNDPDSDGLYNSYSGGAPEIWVGRLTPTFLTFGGSEELLNAYFAKNHAYRTGMLPLPDRALAYEEAFTGLTNYLDLLYTDVTRKNNPAATNADDFKQELLNSYEWVHLISHSSPWGSSFHDGAPPEGGGTLNFFEVPPLDPQAFFYVLNCCSNGRWTEMDNLANTYIWTDSYGLAVLAQSKVDYTNDFQEYYQSLANGSNLGDAFRIWLSGNMSMEDGAVLFGDPTLVPRTNATGAGMTPGGAGGVDAASWLDYTVTDNLHTQGSIDTYFDPDGGLLFAVSGTSEPVRSNILATCFDGDSWAAPMIVCQHEYWDWHATVGGDGQGSVWTGWQSMRDNQEGYDIYLSQWNGSGWGSAQAMTSGDPYDVMPALSGGNGHTWLVWQKWQGGQPDIMGRMWTGSAWTVEEELAASGYSERSPDVAWNGTGFGLVYQVKTDDGWAIGFRDAPDSGPFGPEVLLSPSSDESRFPRIAGMPGGFAVVWQRQDGGVMYASNASGSWSAPELVSGGDHCSRPSVAVDASGNVLVSFTAERSAIRVNSWNGSAWSGVDTAVSGEAVDQGSAAFNEAGVPWLVYGVRDGELHWNLHSATPDPLSAGGTPEGGMALSIVNSGTNPVGSSASFTVCAGGPARFMVFDMSGRVVRSAMVQPGIVTLDCGDLASGVYMVRVESEGSTAGTRFVRLR